MRSFTDGLGIRQLWSSLQPKQRYFRTQQYFTYSDTLYVRDGIIYGTRECETLYRKGGQRHLSPVSFWSVCCTSSLCSWRHDGWDISGAVLQVSPKTIIGGIALVYISPILIWYRCAQQRCLAYPGDIWLEYTLVPVPLGYVLVEGGLLTDIMLTAVTNYCCRHAELGVSTNSADCSFPIRSGFSCNNILIQA